MKILKSLVASFLLIAITTAFATQSHAQAISGAGELQWTGASASPAIDFVIGSTASSQLSTRSNWEASIQNPNTYTVQSGTSKVDFIQFSVFSGTIDDNDPPTVQLLLNEIKAVYDLNGWSSNPFNTATIKGVVFTVTVRKK